MTITRMTKQTGACAIQKHDLFVIAAAQQDTLHLLLRLRFSDYLLLLGLNSNFTFSRHFFITDFWRINQKQKKLRFLERQNVQWFSVIKKSESVFTSLAWLRRIERKQTGKYTVCERTSREYASSKTGELLFSILYSIPVHVDTKMQGIRGY